MNIQSIIKEIIPPSDYQHRNRFSNIPIINKLTRTEKKQLEDALIEMLLNKDGRQIDTLVVETMAYLKSEKSLSILKGLLDDFSDEMRTLFIATSIFEISKDGRMINIAINSLKEMDNKNDLYYTDKLIDAFYYLQKFNRSETDTVVKLYIDHKDFLVAYNAKRTLGLLED